MVFARKKRQSEKLLEAIRDTKMAQNEIAALGKQVKHNNALVRALWQVLRSRLELDDKALDSALKAIETAEREPAHASEFCPHCGRSLQKSRDKCLYCEKPVERRQIAW